MSSPVPPLDLRDIHLPDPISWWPPALGWWLLAGILLTVFAILWFFQYWMQENRLRKLALAELERLAADYEGHRDGHRLARGLSALLRRVCLSFSSLCHGRARDVKGAPATLYANVAGLTGEAWLVFLEQNMSDQPFTKGPGRILLSAPFQNGGGEEMAHHVEIAALLALCRTWVRAISGEHFSLKKQ